MFRKVFRTGNSLVIALPKEAVELLGLAEGKEVSLELDRENRQVILAPVEYTLSSAGVDPEFARQVSDFITQYRTALEALAKK
jgi:putative addiction module antidote